MSTFQIHFIITPSGDPALERRSESFCRFIIRSKVQRRLDELELHQDESTVRIPNEIDPSIQWRRLQMSQDTRARRYARRSRLDGKDLSPMLLLNAEVQRLRRLDHSVTEAAVKMKKRG